MACFSLYAKTNTVNNRTWSRFQNRCITPELNITALDIYDNNSIVSKEVKYNLPSYAKGNILQYKKNSSNLTKNQRYAQIAKGAWTNRTKTWATQNQKYTNPNTSFLKRINVITNTTLSGFPTNLRVTCSDNPSVLTPDTTIIADGGTLLCNSLENPCNGNSVTFSSSSFCNPTTSSNVPGPITYLCYNTSIQTYYPRQKFTMNNSLNKWPINAKDLCRSANSLVSYDCYI